MGGKASKLTPTDVEDIRNFADLTTEEVLEWYTSFKRDCPNGKLTVQDFTKLYQDMFPTGNAESFAQYAFRTFDDDNSGSIDFKEFMYAICITNQGSYEQKLQCSK